MDIVDRKYTKEQCEAFNNQQHLKQLMEVTNEIKNIKDCMAEK